MIRTFIDSDVLIYAARGSSDKATRAMEILLDESRSFVSSVFVQLEVLPKSLYERRKMEASFYETFFDRVETWVPPSSLLIETSFELARTFGLAAMDALHIAAARSAKVEQFITGERPTSPVFRVTGIPIISL